MVLMGVCGALVLLGVALAAVLSGTSPMPREEGLDGSFRTHVPRIARSFAAATAGGAGAGLLLAGPGGRLIMRLLAVTAGDGAQGRTTEAEQRVGDITLDGTFGLIVFSAVLFGVGSGFLYLMLRRWLPQGRIGGLAFGGVLLVVVATRLDPLRPNNEDFDIVGPGWLSVLAFGGLAILHGTLVAGIVNSWERLATSLQGRSKFMGYLPIALYVPVLPFLILVVLAGALATALATQRQVADLLASQRAVQAGRAVLAAAVIIALPFTVLDLVDMIRRGPGASSGNVGALHKLT